MQSSVVVALRTMIMLTCLVAVPLAALLGSALPKVVKSALGGRETSFMSAADGEPTPPVVTLSPADEGVLDEADSDLGPPAADSDLAELRAPLPSAHIIGVREAPEGPPSRAAGQESVEAEIETAPLWRPPPRTARAPRPSDTIARFAPTPASGRRSEMRTESLPKTAYSPPDEEPKDDSLDTDEAGDSRQLAPVERPADDNPFVDSERRLRKLGAIYYRLETWGDEGQFYRCSCSVALTPRSRATRHFEAVDSAPSRAIGAVIQEVRAWQAAKARGRE